ncbi:MAG TPA: amidase family protein, partial [Candidatus Angelobacter sp.]|nr:amidase family protein [Candidatus Angelobacter sp.]
MQRSRREFLAQMTASVLGAAVAPEVIAQQQQPTPPAKPGEPPAGTPPAFGTAPPVGPEVSSGTFAEAERLVRVDMTDPERAEAAGNWRMAMAPLYERRTGPNKVEIEPADLPYSLWNPVLPGEKAGPQRDQFIRSKAEPGPLPKNEEEIAFAPVTHLSSWIQRRQITSTRLTQIYLDRLKRFDPKLRCVITLTSDLALEQAKQADREIAAGKYRGPLHGIPWGGKDLLDTAGIPTTYGAEPFRNRVPKDDAAVVKRLHAAGA